MEESEWADGATLDYPVNEYPVEYADDSADDSPAPRQPGNSATHQQSDTLPLSDVDSQVSPVKKPMFPSTYFQ